MTCYFNSVISRYSTIVPKLIWFMLWIYFFFKIMQLLLLHDLIYYRLDDITFYHFFSALISLVGRGNRIQL